MRVSSSPPPGSRIPRGCFWCGVPVGLAGLCTCLVVFALVVLPSLIGPTPNDLAGGAPDPVASAALTSTLNEAGLEGARALVFPIRGSDQQFAYIVLDDAAGFAGADTVEGNEQAFVAALAGLSEVNREGDLNLGVVAMEYRDESGATLFTVASPQENVEAYASGAVGKEQFLKGADADLSSLLSQFPELVGGVTQ